MNDNIRILRVRQVADTYAVQIMRLKIVRKLQVLKTMRYLTKSTTARRGKLISPVCRVIKSRMKISVETMGTLATDWYRDDHYIVTYYVLRTGDSHRLLKKKKTPKNSITHRIQYIIILRNRATVKQCVPNIVRNGNYSSVSTYSQMSVDRLEQLFM